MSRKIRTKQLLDLENLVMGHCMPFDMALGRVMLRYKLDADQIATMRKDYDQRLESWLQARCEPRAKPLPDTMYRHTR